MTWIVTIVVCFAMLKVSGIPFGLGSEGAPMLFPLITLPLIWGGVRRTGNSSDSKPPKTTQRERMFGAAMLIVLCVLIVVFSDQTGFARHRAISIAVATALVLGFGLVFGAGGSKTLIKVWKLEFQGAHFAAVSWCAVFVVLELIGTRT